VVARHAAQATIKKRTEDEEDNGDGLIQHGVPERTERDGVDSNGGDARDANVRGRCSDEHHEANEEAVVALAYAVADPRAVVIELQDAVVAIAAVFGPGRPRDAARFAVLVALGALLARQRDEVR